MGNQPVKENSGAVLSDVVDRVFEFTDKAVDDPAELKSLGNIRSSRRVLVDTVDQLVQFTDRPGLMPQK